MNWKLSAACNADDVDPDLWHPQPGDSAGAGEAKRICNTQCPVRDECLEYAVTFPVTLTGIWGGKSRREVRAIRVRRGLKVESEAQFSNLPNCVKREEKEIEYHG